MRNRADMFREKRSKQNIILNSLIILVFVLILIVGANLIFGGEDTAKDSETNNASDNEPKEEIKITEDENNEQQSDTEKSEEESSSNQDGDESSEQNEGETESSEQNKDAIDQLEVEEGDDTENDENNSTGEESQDDSGVNESQIGKPIGTSQTGEHTSSYERGTVDWNEKIKAIQMATGLDDSMTLWRLENGGGPDKSVGKVSPDGVQDWMYVVNLQWVDQKGWKVTSVERVSR